MEKLQITGTIKRVEEIKTVGTAEFKTRELHLVTEEQYPQTLAVQFVQDKVNAMDIFPLGTRVTIDVNLKGREWTNAEGKITVFNTIQGWKIERAS
jgi:hypothetical protein